MSEAFLNVVTEQLLNKVLSRVAEEMRLAWGFKSELNNLSERLERAQALLCDAQSGPVTKKSVQGWLTDLRTVACDADDVLDEFAYKVLRGRLQVEKQLRSKVRNFFSPSNPLIFRLNMAHKVKNINIKFNDIYKQANDIGLKPLKIKNDVEHRETRQTHPYVDDSKVVGRDGDVSTLLDMLLGSNDAVVDLPMIAIVGMGGLGKTTLAQLVYNDEKVVSNFGERMWVCVSTDFNVKKILNEMLESVTRTKDEMSNIEAKIKKLRDNLSGQKYLLVLDDVWNENLESWDNMRNSLLGIGGAKGSKIVVTTRSKVVASTMQISPSHTHLLDPLSKNDSWIIFEKRAFADGGPTQTSSLVDVGKRLIGRCGGLPLAIKALGALMYLKKDENEWISIEKSETWSNTDILPTLKLSFDHLPSPSLKQCFAYCSLFPKGSIFGKNYVIELWMAQGYLEPPEGNSLEMEDRGNNYFDSLLWNSLLEVVEKDEYDNVIRCKMHDLVHDLALNIAKGSCLTMETGKVYDNYKVQHLSILVFGTGKAPELSKGSCHKLRTLLIIGDFFGDFLLREFTCLHVLDLVQCQIEELPKSIGKLIHLRFLNMSGTPIITLPNSISKLHHLQTFNVEGCSFLEALPKEFKNLVSLRHFYMDDDEEHRKLMPMGMGQLTCLQTLPFFVVGQDKGRRIEELGCLSNLRGVLNIYNLEHVRSKAEAEQANLSTNSNIQELKLHWCGEREADSNRDEDVLEGLKPHRNLKGLTIENFYGGKLASWMFTRNDTWLLYGLVELNLKNCKTLEYIPTLGHLPGLKILSIEGMHNVKHIGFEFYELDGEIREMTTGAATTEIFPALRELSLVDMPNLLEWSEADCWRSGVRVVFPCLGKLRISGCSNLISVPADFPTIKELVIKEINSVALAKMSNSLTSLTSLSLFGSSGHEINFVLSNLLKNNRCIKKLAIGRCEELSRLPKELWGLASLELFHIDRCPNLISVPDIIIEEETGGGGGGNAIYRLREIQITDCNKLSCLPKGLRNLTSLDKLYIGGCGNLTVINPSDILGLKSLRRLGIVDCGILETSSCWPEWFFSLTNLETLAIGFFPVELDYFPWPSFSSLSTSSSSTFTHDSQPLPPENLLLSLKCLVLYGWPNLESLPDQLQQLTSLVELTLLGFDGLESLPDWLGNLSSLESLGLYNCKNLTHLPSVESIRRLKHLEITNCPLLAERCKRGSGPEWNKIAHIPSIKIDKKYIQNKL